MATVTEVKKICDLTGDPAHETVKFALDGVGYEIDLAANNAGVLRDILGDYVTAGRKVSKSEVLSGRSKPGRSARVSADRDQIAAIREWARKAGHQVADRGRIPASVVEAFEQAHRPGALAAAS
jgi:nucleoid-associated protein Lsr2